ncbi:hypothetical protein Tco_0870713 [Tanacetum coccineum]
MADNERVIDDVAEIIDVFVEIALLDDKGYRVLSVSHSRGFVKRLRSTYTSRNYIVVFNGEAVDLLEDMRYELGGSQLSLYRLHCIPTSEEMIQAEVHVEDKANYRYL